MRSIDDDTRYNHPEISSVGSRSLPAIDDDKCSGSQERFRHHRRLPFWRADGEAEVANDDSRLSTSFSGRAKVAVC